MRDCHRGYWHWTVVLYSSAPSRRPVPPKPPAMRTIPLRARVAPGDFSPRAPTDPDVQYDRIRLFESGVCCPGVDAVHDPRWGKRVSGEQCEEARPCKAGSL